MRTTLAFLAVIAIAAVACGSGAAGGGEDTGGAAAPEAGTAGATAGKPEAEVPPTRSASPGKPRVMRGGPPPALIETPAGSAWLAFGSYCWSGPAEKGTVSMLCADMAPTATDDLPVVRFVPGRGIRIRLGFAPREVSLTVGGSPILLQPRRVLEWTATRGGILELVVIPERGGDATYRARLVSTVRVAS